MSLKIIYAGTAEFAIPALKALIDSPHEILAVYTRPDSPAGRGLKLTPTAVKKFALEHNLPVHQPENLKSAEAQDMMRQLHADIMIDIAYGVFLPPEVLDLYPYGCINAHPSLLPKWRGAAPIQRAILAGDDHTGTTIMQVDAGWDTGPILQQKKITISNTDTSASLHDQLAQLSAELLLDTLTKLEHQQITPVSQDDTKSCYANKITKEEAKIDWQTTAIEIERKTRAFNPAPVAFTLLNGTMIRIWQTAASNTPTDAQPGSIIAHKNNSIDVATKSGILHILQLQMPGGKILPAIELLKSKTELFAVGISFDA